jgi:hypothetical protein
MMTNLLEDMVPSKIAAIIAYVAGTLLLLAGTTGSVGIIGTIIVYIIDTLGGRTADILYIFLQILQLIADLGGAAVIIGGSLIFNDRRTTGKFMILLGAGMGLFGFLITLASALIHGWASTINFLLLITQSIGWIGVILAITATLIAK